MTLKEIGTVDAATCRAINADVRAHPDKVALANQAAIAKLTDTGCRLVVVLTTRVGLPIGAATAAAATSCTYVYKALHIYSGPFETYTAHDDAYVCWNGTTAWQQDYRHCYVTSYPLGFGGSDWCGTINNNTATVTLQNDFYIASYSAPWWHRPGWMSYTVNKFGSVSAVSGFCCN
ncbi:MAG: hypothetical protein V4515_14040 [Chloroflexota bacterium]